MELRQEDAIELLEQWEGVLNKYSRATHKVSSSEENPYNIAIDTLNNVKNGEKVGDDVFNDIGNKLNQLKDDTLTPPLQQDDITDFLNHLNKKLLNKKLQPVTHMIAQLNKVQLMKQIFLPTNKETPKEQAARIVSAFVTELQGNTKKIAFIFSANNKQVMQFTTDTPFPNIEGKGQAELVNEIIKQIKNQTPDIQERLKILPFATSLNGNDNNAKNSVGVTEIQRDLNSIQTALQDDYIVYCLPRGHNDKEANEFSLGGNVSTHWKKQDCYKVYNSKDNIYSSQFEFVQNKLDTMSNKSGQLDLKKEGIFMGTNPKSQYLKYAAAVDGSNLKKELKKLKVNALKTKILEEFKKNINLAETQDNLDSKINTFKQSPEYATLTQNQRLFSRIFGGTTSSAKAVEDLITERKKEIEEAQNSSITHGNT